MNTNNSTIVPRDEKEQALLSTPQIDPVQSVIELLTVAGHPRPEAWTDGLHPVARDSDMQWEMRQHYVNLKLAEVLGMCDEDTTRARFCLIEGGMPNVWIVMIKQEVVPVMVRLNLPGDQF